MQTICVPNIAPLPQTGQLEPDLYDILGMGPLTAPNPPNQSTANPPNSNKRQTRSGAVFGSG